MFCKYIYICFFRIGVLVTVNIAEVRRSLSEDQRSPLSYNFSPAQGSMEVEMEWFFALLGALALLLLLKGLGAI